MSEGMSNGTTKDKLLKNMISQRYVRRQQERDESSLDLNTIMMLTTHIPNDYSNDVVDLLDYNVVTLPQFQDIVDKIGKKGKFGDWLSARMKLGERPVIFLGQDEAIFKQYIFTKNMWNHKGIFWIVPKDQGYGIMVSAFQYQYFGFVYPLTVPDLQTIN